MTTTARPEQQHSTVPAPLLRYLAGEWAMEPSAYTQLTTRLLSLPAEAFLFWDDEDEPAPGKKDKKPYQLASGVAIVALTGTLQKREDWLSRYFPGEFCATETFARTVRQAASDPEVTALVLQVDSPGGLVDGVSEAAEAVYAVRQGGKKPVVAVAAGMCCSAAYWIASQASEVWAGETDLIGSIGTRLRLLDTSAFYEALGITPVEITTGTYKSAGADGLPITPEQVLYFQGIADRTQERFTAGVARGRKLPVDDVRALAREARVYVGREAEGVGLINGVATLTETVNRLQKSGGSRAGRSTAAQSGTEEGSVMSRMDSFLAWLKGEGDQPEEKDQPLAVAATATRVQGEPLRPLEGHVSLLESEHRTLTAQAAAGRAALEELQAELLADTIRAEGQANPLLTELAAACVERGEYARLKTLRDAQAAKVRETIPTGTSADRKAATRGTAPDTQGAGEGRPSKEEVEADAAGVVARSRGKKVAVRGLNGHGRGGE